MSFLQRIADVLTKPAPPGPNRPEPSLPPPEGSVTLDRAMNELDESTAELRRLLERPMPSVADVFLTADRARGNGGTR